MRPAGVPILGVLLMFALWVACSASETMPSDTLDGVWESAAAVPEAGSIRYRYEWDLEGVSLADDGASWTVVTDLGYEVTVHESYFVSASVQLTQCVEEEGILGRVWSTLFGIPSARAGHSSEYNPAAVTLGIVERLNQLTNVDAGTTTELTERFCSVHYLVAAGDKETRALPDAIQMVDRSLYVQGTWKAPDSDVVVPFTVDSALGWGALTELYPPGSYKTPGAQFEVEPVDAGVLVVVRRRAQVMFDGVDFASDGENVLPTRILSAMFAGIEIGVIVDEETL
jgi:hypothetical protein